MEFLFFTCSSSWIEAARGRPSATLAIMVIKIIFLDLWNFESDTKHQSASKSSISVYISRWEWHCTTIFKAQKISRKNGENATVLLFITGNNFNLTRNISKLLFCENLAKTSFLRKISLFLFKIVSVKVGDWLRSELSLEAENITKLEDFLFLPKNGYRYNKSGFTASRRNHVPYQSRLLSQLYDAIWGKKPKNPKNQASQERNLNKIKTIKKSFWN